jgi:3-phosphoshikimate 1-carboxyvinyltransferase
MNEILTVTGGRPLVGVVELPGDKSISHRALLLGAVAEGTSEIRGLSDGDDVRRTADAVRALGAVLVGPAISGGPDRVRQPSAPLDLGNSGTSIRLLAGLVAGWDMTVVMGGDASLSGRPMDRVAVPLRLMGATVEGRGERCLPPLTVTGGKLRAIDYTPPMASAQVKSCVLLAGLRAEGETVVREPVLTRLHTEEMLARCGAAISEEVDDGAHVVRLRPSDLRPFSLDIPADPSQAAFWVVAGCVVPGSDITMPRVYVGPGRRGFLDLLRRMGADIDEVADRGPDDLAATATVRARYGALRGTTVAGAEISGLDEVPVLAVAAACAAGDTVFTDVGELRVKESDRLAAVVALVRSFGGRAEAEGDDLVVHGTGSLSAADVDAGGDHRMAMAAAVAAAAVESAGASHIAGFASVATSYPGFADHLDALAGRHRGSSS